MKALPWRQQNLSGRVYFWSIFVWLNSWAAGVGDRLAFMILYWERFTFIPRDINPPGVFNCILKLKNCLFCGWCAMYSLAYVCFDLWVVDGFERAALSWSTHFSDPVYVNSYPLNGMDSQELDDASDTASSKNRVVWLGTSRLRTRVLLHVAPAASLNCLCPSSQARNVYKELLQVC